MTDFTNQTFKETYRDFYKKEDGYYRVLFNSGRALQARELTESQRMIHEEIARFGRNIFKEGAMVNPGGATVDNSLEYIRLSPASIYTDIVGREVTNGSVVFTVLEVVDSENNDPITLYVKYTDTLNAQTLDDSVAPRVLPSQSLRFSDGTTTGINMVVASTTAEHPCAGKATKAYLAEGDFFVQGHFVYVEAGSAFIDKYSGTPTADLGFLVQQSIVSSAEDDSLFDNQGQLPDISAPGADRYKIKLIPTTRDQVLEEENFVFIARVVNGVITREVNSFDAYNRINSLLAQRTKEESGDYVVEDFTAIFENQDDDTFNVDVSEGIAYVDGYRLDVGATTLQVPKTTGDSALRVKLNENVPAIFGNWIYVDLDDAGSQGLGDINTFGRLQLKSADSTILGYANLRGLQSDQVGYRAYLFNIRMNRDPSTQIQYNFSTVTRLIEASTGNEIPVTSNANLKGIYGTADNNLLFPLSSVAAKPDTISNIVYTAQKFYRLTSNSSGIISMPANSVEFSQWLIAETDGPVRTDIVITSKDIEGLTPSTSYDIISYEEITAAPKTKSLQTRTIIATRPDVTWAIRPIDLGVIDGVSLESVKVRSSSSTDWDDADDITYQVDFDGGQRDNYYDLTRLYVKPGYSTPTGANVEVQVIFSHFQHSSSSGGFFCAKSYTGTAIQDIPSHTLTNGAVVKLGDSLDFRPSYATVDTFTVTPLPQNASSITVPSISYYSPRIDMLVVNATDSRGDIGFGELQVISGQAAEQPKEPIIPVGALPLFKIELGAYSHQTSDVITTKISNKRYTMKDIGKLEEGIENLYEITALSFLESNTNSLDVLDAQGLNRTKAGFIADNFNTFDYSDIEHPDYRASVDPAGLMGASFREQAVRLKYDAADVSNTITKKGDVVTLPFTDVAMINQELATGTMNINPFAVITQNGHLTLSPSTDEWVETKFLPDIMQRVVRRISTYLPSFFQRRRFRVQSSTTSRTITEYIGRRVMNIEIIPFMRSRKVNFRVQGLRPNTQMWPVFGNKVVSDWVRQEAEFTNFSDDPTEYGSEYISATEYPTALGGKSILTTNAEGELAGSFFLPNTSTINFRTGRQEFKLLDVNNTDESVATAVSRAGYTALGTLETVQRTVRSTRIIETTYWRDPLAQTFIVDQVENPNGLFITKVDIFVESKDSVIPMQVQIRPVENGVPTARTIPGSVKFINAADINVVPFDNTTEMSDIIAGKTTIEFDEPIYLTSGEEYAIVLLAESVEYNVYTAQTYEYVVGQSRSARVSRQPTLGSLFLSQNGSTWTPDQTKDLMFNLYRADFESSGVLELKNGELPKVTLDNNPLETTLGSSIVSVYHEGHGFSNNDGVLISGVTNAVGGIIADSINGYHNVINPTWEGYTINTGVAATASAVGGGSSVVTSQQVMFDQFIPQVQTLIPNMTSIDSTIEKTLGDSYGTTRTTRPQKLEYTTKSHQVVLNELNVNDYPAVVATQANAVDTLSLTLNLTTGDSKVSPVVDLQRVSLITLENVIDGSDAAQHITKPVAVDESSVGLKIIFAAHRAVGAEFDVYVRTSLTEDAMYEVDAEGVPVIGWSQVSIDSPLPTDDDPETYRDYEYTVEADAFNVFQIKIVMSATNSSNSPTITDLRAIALVI